MKHGSSVSNEVTTRTDSRHFDSPADCYVIVHSIASFNYEPSLLEWSCCALHETKAR